MQERKMCSCAIAHQVPQDPPPSRSHRIVVSLHRQPFVSRIRDASTDRPHQMAHSRESQRILLRSERLCRNRCVAFAVCALSCHIDEFPPLRTKHCLHPNGLRSRTLSSKPVSRSERKLPLPRRNRPACMSLRKLLEIARRASKWRASVHRPFREALAHRTNNQFASRVVFHRQCSPRSTHPDSPHIVRSYESLRNVAGATGGRGRVRRPPLTAPSGSCQLPAGDVWQGRHRGWPRANSPSRCHSFAPSLNEDLCPLGLESETHFRQSSLAHRITQASLIFGVEHEKTAPACAD